MVGTETVDRRADSHEGMGVNVCARDGGVGKFGTFGVARVSGVHIEARDKRH